MLACSARPTLWLLKLRLKDRTRTTAGQQKRKFLLQLLSLAVGQQWRVNAAMFVIQLCERGRFNLTVKDYLLL